MRVVPPIAGLAICLAFCALVVPAAAQIADFSFESSFPGNPPAAPWTVVAGSAYIENSGTAFFPTHGGQYLRLALSGNSAGPAGMAPSSPGYGPHTSGVAQVKQIFSVPNHQNIGLSVDWEFINAESPTTTSYFDFASIDVIDPLGALVANVLLVCAGNPAASPPFTNVPGAGAGAIAWVPNQTALPYQSAYNPAPAGFKRAFVDLTGLMLPGTSYSLEITIANWGDSSLGPQLLVDNVRLVGGQVNQGNGSLRILGSSHLDGSGSFSDWSGDYLGIGPYEFYTEPGARIAFRARSSVASTPWALFTGPLQFNGIYLAGVGTVNLDVSSPSFATVIDGIVPGGGDDIIGTISFNTNFIEGQVAASTPTGTEVGYQALMLVPSAPNPIVLTAATEVVVGGTSTYGSSFHPRTPVGYSNLGLGDDSYGTVDFVAAGFGGFSFYGVTYTQCFVGSNGYVTFASGDSSPSEGGAAMLSGPPRISLLWDDLNPSTTSPSGNGSVNWYTTSTALTISWNHVGESGFLGARNNFAVQFYSSGSFTLYYGSTSPEAGLVGISPGGLTAPANTEHSNVDWSNYSPGSRGTIASGTAGFERFRYADLAGLLRDTLDIANVHRIHFEPDGSGGYTYFVGLR